MAFPIYVWNTKMSSIVGHFIQKRTDEFRWSVLKWHTYRYTWMSFKFQIWLGNTAQIKLKLGVFAILKVKLKDHWLYLVPIDSFAKESVHLRLLQKYILLKFLFRIEIHHQKYLALINALESNYFFFSKILFFKNSQKELKFIWVFLYFFQDHDNDKHSSIRARTTSNSNLDPLELNTTSKEGRSRWVKNNISN